MSLINDALKRAEKSLNDNSSDQHRERIPSFDFEPSKRNNKLFLVALIGGTLFFSVLIALIMLLRSPAPTPKPTPPTPSTTPTLIPENLSGKEAPEAIVQVQETIEPESNENTLDGPINSEEDPEELPPTDPAESIEQSSTAEAPTTPQVGSKNDLNKEFVEGIVGLASRAFTGPPPSNKNSQQAPEPEPKDYSLSTAQETLELLEKQAKNNKPADTPENPIHEFIQSLSITGVMIANEGSQVLINNHVYSNHSVIDSSLHLILSEIKPHSITLRDSTGKTYVKEF